MGKLIYPKLSYQIIGILFEVHSSLGGRYREKYYQKAVEAELQNLKISYQKELLVDLEYKGHKVGRYFLDFLIEEKIILELKTKPKLEGEDFRQVMAYLRARELKLGILANFRGRKLIFKRILNPDYKSKFQ